ncbi:hemolysin family protein [Bacteroidota bacterium]
MGNLIIIFISLIFSAFFSGLEIAFVTSNKLRIEVERKKGNISSKINSFLNKNPSHYIATMLVGNNIALVIYGIQMAIVLEPTIRNFIDADYAVLAIQTIISTLIILLTAEFLPKTMFRLNPNRFLNIFSVPVLFFFYLLYPISIVALKLSNILIKSTLKKGDSQNQIKHTFGRVDLDHYFTEMKTNSETPDDIEHDVKIFQNALDFSKLKLRECMIPRTEITALEVNNTISELKQKFIETGYSRILIYKDNIDKIIGFANSYDIYKNPDKIKTVLNQVHIVPETMPAQKLLKSLMEEKKSIAVVVDEFGGTAGMVTTEDILEEIFGEIEDEHDTTDLVEKKINDMEYIFSGRQEIDYLNEKYNLNIPDSDEYETLAGFIFFNYESMPRNGDIINIEPFEFKIIEASKTRIIEIKLINKHK